jgi:alpha/beta superfamily hydrolase
MSSNLTSETIVPSYFGQDCSLYGCCHQSAECEQAPALVICQPTGHEYERCHRAMRQLAVQAVRKGFSALRFDYCATGDSAGDCEDLNLSQMRQDIRQAIRFACDKTGSNRVALVGLRLGATLAAQVAADCVEVDSLVLYAPVFDGAELLREWQVAHQSFYARHSDLSTPEVSTEVLGFPLSEGLKAELDQSFIPESTYSSVKRVLILIDQAEANSALLDQWVESFTRQGIEVTVEVGDDIAIWRRGPMEAIVPIKMIRRIVKWVGDDEHA